MVRGQQLATEGARLNSFLFLDWSIWLIEVFPATWLADDGVWHSASKCLDLESVCPSMGKLEVLKGACLCSWLANIVRLCPNCLELCSRCQLVPSCWIARWYVCDLIHMLPNTSTSSTSFTTVDQHSRILLYTLNFPFIGGSHCKHRSLWFHWAVGADLRSLSFVTEAQSLRPLSSQQSAQTPEQQPQWNMRMLSADCTESVSDFCWKALDI